MLQIVVSTYAIQNSSQRLCSWKHATRFSYRKTVFPCFSAFRHSINSSHCPSGVQHTIRDRLARLYSFLLPCQLAVNGARVKCAKTVDFSSCRESHHAENPKKNCWMMPKHFDLATTFSTPNGGVENTPCTADDEFLLSRLYSIYLCAFTLQVWRDVIPTTR